MVHLRNAPRVMRSMVLYVADNGNMIKATSCKQNVAAQKLEKCTKLRNRGTKDKSQEIRAGTTKALYS